MFLESQELELLEDYVEAKKDKALYKWWANYLESQNKLDLALKYYKLADDTQS
jgi:intraflagellar transport protein 140